MTDGEIGLLLLNLVLLLAGARATGRLFARFRQPPVIGEIVGGLLFGPTFLGAFAPGLEGRLFPDHGATSAALAFLFQIGLLLLMFTTGTQMRRMADRQDSSTVALVLLLGTVIPFGAGLLLAVALPTDLLIGTAGNETALMLVIAVSVAITSIPVISRILLDLGLLGTRLARVVLAVSVGEDILLNIVLAVALGLVQAQHDSGTGLIGLLGISPGGDSVAFHAAAPIVFLFAALLMARSPRLTALLRDWIGPSATALLVLVFAVCALCVFIGVAPMFGAFVVGLLVGRTCPDEHTAGLSIRPIQVVAAAFFVPLYFASVGRTLDLRHNLDFWLTLGVVAIACLVKASSVYLAARATGNPSAWSFDLAVAVNARGGPGIVTATVAYAGGIVNATFFTTLILLAVLTSLLAGTWLQHNRARVLATDDLDSDVTPNPSPFRGDT